MEEAMSSGTDLIYSKELHEAALAGDADAQEDLAICYSKGWGVKQDQVKAFQWYSLAAEQDHPNALHNLGLRYSSGKGVETDQDKAIECWQRAADLDFDFSHFALGFCYLDGDGVPPDTAQALAHFTRAAEQGYPSAMLETAELLNDVSAGFYQPRKAYCWVYLAARLREEDALQLLRDYEKYMEEELIAELRAEALEQLPALRQYEYIRAPEYSEEEWAAVWDRFLSGADNEDDDDDDDDEDYVLPIPPQGLFTGGDGSSFEQAVKINPEIPGEGVSCEYYWLDLLGREKSLRWVLNSQRLKYYNLVYFDVIEVTWSDGSQQKVYFDIGEFYGKG